MSGVLHDAITAGLATFGGIVLIGMLLDRLPRPLAIVVAVCLLLLALSLCIQTSRTSWCPAPMHIYQTDNSGMVCR